MSFIKYDLNTIVQEDHPLKKIFKVINFKTISLDFKEIFNTDFHKALNSLNPTLKYHNLNYPTAQTLRRINGFNALPYFFRHKVGQRNDD